MAAFYGICVQGTLLSQKLPIPLGKTSSSRPFLGLSGAAGLRSPQSGWMMLRPGDGEDLCRSFILEEEVSLCCWLIVNGQFCGIGVVMTFFWRPNHEAYFFLIVHLHHHLLWLKLLLVYLSVAWCRMNLPFSNLTAETIPLITDLLP